MKQITELARTMLNKVTPQILKRKTIISANDEEAVLTALKKEAVIMFASGNLKGARELSAFVESKPVLQIWPGNGFLYMAQNHGKPDSEEKVIVYTDEKDFEGVKQLEQAVLKIQQRRLCQH